MKPANGLLSKKQMRVKSRHMVRLHCRGAEVHALGVVVHIHATKEKQST